VVPVAAWEVLPGLLASFCGGRTRWIWRTRRRRSSGTQAGERLPGATSTASRATGVDYCRSRRHYEVRPPEIVRDRSSDLLAHAWWVTLVSKSGSVSRSVKGSPRTPFLASGRSERSATWRHCPKPKRHRTGSTGWRRNKRCWIWRARGLPWGPMPLSDFARAMPTMTRTGSQWRMSFARRRSVLLASRTRAQQPGPGARSCRADKRRKHRQYSSGACRETSLWRFIIGSKTSPQTGSTTFICRASTGSQRVIVGYPTMAVRQAAGLMQRRRGGSHRL
jgi:hypothetical protein